VLELFIQDLFVSSSFRGQGFGKILLEKAVLEAKVLMVEILSLHVFAKNEIACKLYRKFGFKITKKSSDSELNMIYKIV
jgi:ribosomal protein S18 acetylase RimI-like enzyme